MQPGLTKAPKFLYLGLDTDETSDWYDAERRFTQEDLYQFATEVARYQLVKTGTVELIRSIKWDKPKQKQSNKKRQKNGKSKKNDA